MINKTVAEEQSGFRGGRSTVDRTFTLRPVIEEWVQQDRETHVALIDTENVCGDVPIEILWKNGNVDINPMLIEATVNLYDKNATIKIGGKLTEKC